nr:Lipid-binding serum glycoprotein domain containing protein [Haemonchus contortus]
MFHRLYPLLLLLGFLVPIHTLTNGSASRNAGIYFRLNQKAVDYITELASDAMPQILNNMHIPDVTVTSATISKIHINHVEKPTIQAKFLRDRGVRANVSLPYLRTSADCSVDSFFILDGSFVVELHNFTIEIELNIKRNETSGRNIFEVPHCETTHSDVNILLEQNSLLAIIQGTLQSTISDAVRTQICETILDAVKFVDAHELQPVDHDKDSSTTTLTSVTSAESGFDPAEFGASLCEIQQLKETSTFSTLSPSISSENVRSQGSSWSANLDLVYPPRFSDEDVVFGIDGGLLYNSTSASNVGHPPALNTSVLNTKMIGILITDSIPNTFFAHIFNNELGSLYERIEPQHLPKPFKKIASMMCSKCFLEISANLTEQPRVEINAKQGARVQLAGDVLLQFQGREELYNLINASTRLHVTLKPTIRHSRLYGDIALTNVDVKVYDLAVGGVLSKPIEKLVSFIVPRVLWPQVKKRIRFAWNRRGIQLPVLCGVELEHLSLSYIDRAAVINTDFRFDLPLFVRKFKLYLIQKSMTFRGIPTYVEI